MSIALTAITPTLLAFQSGILGIQGPPEAADDKGMDRRGTVTSRETNPTDPVGSPERKENLLEKIKVLEGRLQSETDARCKAEATSRRCEAELRIFMQAEASSEHRVSEMEMKLGNEVHARQVVEEWRLHMRKLIYAIEDLHWERARAQSSHDASGWMEWVQKYEAAIVVRQYQG